MCATAGVRLSRGGDALRGRVARVSALVDHVRAVRARRRRAEPRAPTGRRRHLLQSHQGLQQFCVHTMYAAQEGLPSTCTREIEDSPSAVKSRAFDPFAYKTTPLFQPQNHTSHFLHFQEYYSYVQILGLAHFYS